MFRMKVVNIISLFLLQGTFLASACNSLMNNEEARRTPRFISSPEVRDRNVVGSGLQVCSMNPLTGWFRDGYCRTDQNDYGIHVVCATMTEEFLTFTRSRGNDLSTRRGGFPGLNPGDSWCLCAGRWRQAMNAGAAPLVNLQATHVKALRTVTLEQLEHYRDE